MHKNINRKSAVGNGIRNRNKSKLKQYQSYLSSKDIYIANTFTKAIQFNRAIQ